MALQLGMYLEAMDFFGWSSRLGLWDGWDALLQVLIASQDEGQRL
jgi:hypothetical protein